MGSRDEVVEIDRLETALLASDRSYEESEAGEETVLYAASFHEMEENFVKYQTAQWVLYSLLLILAWGIGLIMLFYLPIRRYILRKDIRSRKLYLTPNAIVYEVNRPVAFPFFGVYRREKHVLLPSVADVVVKQGYLQSLFGVYSLRIENTGVRRPSTDDVQILGITDPGAFRKAVLRCLLDMRTQALSKQNSTVQESPDLKTSQSPATWASPSKSLWQDSSSLSPDMLFLRKLEEVGSSVKRVQNLIEEQHGEAPERKV